MANDTSFFSWLEIEAKYLLYGGYAEQNQCKSHKLTNEGGIVLTGERVHGRRTGGQGGLGPAWVLKISAKKVAFSVSSGKNKFHHFWPLSRKII